MPAGICAICNRGSLAHAYECPRWSGASLKVKPRTDHINHDIDHLGTQRTRAKVRALIRSVRQQIYMPFVLTRYQASTGVVVLRHGADEAALEHEREVFERDSRKIYPSPDGASYEVMPRSVLRIRLESVSQTKWEDSLGASTSPTKSGRLFTGT